MTQINLVSRQKKVVVFACIEPETHVAVCRLCEQYEKTADEILLLPRARNEITIRSALHYYRKNTEVFAGKGYTGFVLVGKDKMKNLFHETEILKESYPKLAFDAWRIHTESAKNGIAEVSKIS
jgi:hypothetical protein